MRIDEIKLRTIMMEKDIKQVDLAKLTGISKNGINSICRGRSCKTETADLIAKALGVKTADFSLRVE